MIMVSKLWLWLGYNRLLSFLRQLLWSGITRERSSALHDRWQSSDKQVLRPTHHSPTKKAKKQGTSTAGKKASTWASKTSVNQKQMGQIKPHTCRTAYWGYGTLLIVIGQVWKISHNQLTIYLDVGVNMYCTSETENSWSNNYAQLTCRLWSNLHIIT